jgi:hypothetical protein
MNKARLIPRTRRQLVLRALAMGVGVEAIVWILFHYHYDVRMPLWYWPGIAIFNFVLFVSLLSFIRWLHQKREEWSSSTKSWFGAIMLVVGVALLAAALYLAAPR